MFPLPKVVWKLVVGLFRHNVLFNLVIVLDFFEDRPRVQVHDADDHARLHSVEVKGSEVLLHRGNYVPVLVLESQSDVGRFRSISFLDVFFEGENGALRIESQFWDAK